MLSSFNNTSSSSHDPDEDEPSPSTAAADLHFHHLMAAAPPVVLPPPHTLLPSSSSSSSPFATSAIHVRQLLARCAELMSSQSPDHAAARRLVAALSSASSPLGDSTERLAHQFAAAFSLRLHNISNFSSRDDDPAAMQSCYLSLNQITPFVRFAHLTANQAILESVTPPENEPASGIHIVDFDIMHGVQWPPLMQALAARRPPPSLLRITGAGRDPDALHRTGNRLSMFAQSLGLSFQFHPLRRSRELKLEPGSAYGHVTVVPGEALAVNCMFYLHRLLSNRQEEEEEEEAESALRVFLRSVKELNPRVVTVGERELDGRHVSDAVGYYAAVFESLEETVPPGSGERAAVERVWLGREIREAVVAGGGGSSRRMEWWGRAMRRAGFGNVGLSPFAVSQAKLLLRLHYPCEGYRLQVVDRRDLEEEDRNEGLTVRGLLLGWRDRPLFSFSSWR